MERWLPIPGHAGYEVSDQGRVRSLDRTVPHRRSGRLSLKGRILKPQVSGTKKRTSPGYLSVKLGALSRTWPIHTLVAMSFLGEPMGLQVRHLNGNSHDNRLENLKYGTGRENMQDMSCHQTQWQQKKTQCPIGHLLVEPNLVPSQLRRGWRSCLACVRAKNTLRRFPEADFQKDADKNYEAILA